MKNLILAVLLGILCWNQPLVAQNKNYPNAIHAKLNFSDFGALNDADFRLGQGFEIGYFRNVAPYFNVGLPLKLGLAKLPQTEGNTVAGSLDLLFQVTNTGSTAKLTPYGFGGAGYFFENQSSGHLQFPLGGGVNYRISEFASVNAQLEFRKALKDNRDNLQLGLGFIYLLHKIEKPATPPENAKPADADKDGVADALDKCPEQFGSATTMGCPDADGDGIADAEDGCPDKPGLLETGGCPDTDKDGIADKNDECPDQPGKVRGCPDSDFDGVADKDDACPDQPGRIKGCPDTDFDGVADKDDKCPNEAGSADLQGCPKAAAPADTDGDGIADKDDQCPTQPGVLNGCPDTDGDGIADKDDKCPTETGPASNAGCPVPAKPADTDGDGVPDKDDLCPTQAGPLKGCPDTDGDGIADRDDKCPTQAGPTSNNGCPAPEKPADTDGDGIADKDDQCPTQAGTLNGCPDTDSDGIADDKDPCPTQPGSASGCPDSDYDGVADKDDPCPKQYGKLKGCPDSDNDGVADKDDQCPGQAGTLSGCPDTDNDGVADKDDLCPTQAGKLNGCPDTDNDGVADKDDPCPTQAGSISGCPDTDNDGVADKDDKCPTQAGPASSGGCPPPPTPKPSAAGDLDADGVPDDLDRCPTTPGPVVNRGCPEVRQETKMQLSLAMDAVQFETAKATLVRSSYDILDGIVEIMRQYPDYKLAIGGHTDDIGDDERNLKLSTDRAKACYDYLIFRGVRADRLRFAGFGETRPIADNTTPAGRERNRRVEFELTLD